MFLLSFCQSFFDIVVWIVEVEEVLLFSLGLDGGAVLEG